MHASNDEKMSACYGAVLAHMEMERCDLEDQLHARKSWLKSLNQAIALLQNELDKDARAALGDPKI